MWPKSAWGQHETKSSCKIISAMLLISDQSSEKADVVGRTSAYPR